MVKVLFDTNILIDHFNNVPQARDEILRYSQSSISIVTWIETMVGAPQDREEITRSGLSDFSVIDLNDRIADMAFRLRRTYRLKLSDAVIWASAKVHGLTLVTRDAKDFPENDPGIRIPYTLN